MSHVQKIVGLAVAIVSLVTSALGLAAHLQREAIERDRDRQHIRTLERIIVSEFPTYTPAIDWDVK